MNKNELISAVAARTGVNKKNAEAFMSAFIEVVSGALQNGDKVSISGLGTFEVKEKSRKRRHQPQNQRKDPHRSF